MSSEFVLKWGIVSAGFISSDFCTAVQTLDPKYHQINAITDRKLQDAKTLADKFGIPSHYDSCDKMVTSKEINIVYVGSIISMHKEHCLAAINAGKHVLCEKSMATSSVEQEEVLKAAKAKGVFFMEALWTRFFPLIQKLKQELANGTIGPQVNYFCSSFLAPIKDIERIKRKELGGGAMDEIGIYPIQLACLVMGHEKPTKITCSGHLMETGVDEACSITLLYPGKRIAQINMSTACSLYGSAYIAGEKGCMQIPEFVWCPTKLIMPDGTLHEEHLPDVKTNYDRSVGLRYQAEAIREAIGKGLLEHEFVKHSDSRLIMSIKDESKRQLGYTD
jgi:dihydrodiol dehydrogenase / D-xylose 1-dehydrogenase (NADP)